MADAFFGSKKQGTSSIFTFHELDGLDYSFHIGDVRLDTEILIIHIWVSKNVQVQLSRQEYLLDSGAAAGARGLATMSQHRICKQLELLLSHAIASGLQSSLVVKQC